MGILSEQSGFLNNSMEGAGMIPALSSFQTSSLVLMRTAATVLCSITLCAPLEAQRIDSIPDYLTEPPKLVVKLDMRGSFISNEGVRFAGLKVGMEHAGLVQYGIGYSFLLTPVESSEHVEGLGETPTRVRFGYVSPYFDFAFYRRNNWELRIPVQFGIGGGSVLYTDVEGITRKLRRGTVLLYEPCMTVQYRFLKYFAVGGGWGYRLVLAGPDLADGITAPIYTFGLRIFFGDLWRDVRPEE